MASKARGGLSKREFAAKQQGGILDYKTGKITKPAPKISAPTKKVTYDAKNGTANVSSQPEKRAIGQRTDGSLIYEGETSKSPVYGPMLPQGFKQQVSAVKNYSEKINYSPAKPSREEVLRKAKEEEAKYKKEASTGSVIKNTLKGVKDVFLPGRGFSDKEISEAKPTIKESVTGGFKSAGEIANLIPKAGGLLAKGVAKVAEKAGAKTYAQKVRDIVDKYNEKSDKKLLPKTAGEAKTMRATDVLSTFVGGTVSKSGRVTKTLASASKNVGKNVGKKVASGMTDVGKMIGKDAAIRAEGNAALGRSAAGAGKTIGKTVKENVSVPRARAASLADEGSDSARMVSKTDEAIPDKKVRRGEAPLRDEAFQAEAKAPIERTKVAKLKESETALRAKIAKTLDDAKNAPDEIDELTGKMKPKKDPTAEIDKHISDFRKEFEDMTGEKAPADPDEMIARLHSIERENAGAWRKQDKRWTREKELRSLAGVRQGKTFSRGGRSVSGGKLSGKGGTRKGVLIEARRKTLEARKLAPENIDPKDLIRRTVKDPEGGFREVVIQKSTGQKVADMGTPAENKGGALIRPDRRSLNSVPLKKDDGAIRQIATPQTSATVRQFERAKDLGPAEKKIEDMAFKKIEEHEAEILADYQAKNGKIVNADTFRPYFKEEGYAGHNAQSVQEPSSYLAKRAFTEGLKNDGEFATLYAGGSGTGKTSALKGIEEASNTIKNSSVVLDGNLSSYGSAIKKIEQAVNAGKKVPIYYVYREPVEAFENGVVKRMINNKDEMGRLVPSRVVANNHIGSWETVKRLHNEGFDVHFIDNSLGNGKAKLVSFEDIDKKIRYPSEAQLTMKFDKKAEELYRYGSIDANQYIGYTGKKPPKQVGGANLWQQPWLKEKATAIREVIQDNWIRVKKLTENPNVKVDPNKLTPYEAETLFHGRVGHRLEQATDTLKAIDQDIANAEKALKNPNVRGDIDRYLVAKHAPERNALHGEGAAGMTTEEAKKIVSDFEAMEGSKELKAIAKKIKETNEQTLDILRDSQVIDDDTYKTLRETYKEHVPLNRIFDETEDMGGALVGKGYDVRGTGVKKATGSSREVDDILTNVGANLEQAIVRAEKNRVNLATLDFARENKGLGLFQEIKPKAIGESFDGRPLLERIDDPLVLTVRENGKPVYLRINDEHMATVFKGIGNEKLPPVLNFISGFTRLYSGLATRFNPEFVLSNKVRDLQEMAVYMASQKKIGFSGATKTALRDPASMKDVIDHMRGGNSVGAKLYKQMMEDGGTTGGQALSTRKQLKIDLDAIRKLNRGGILNMKQQGKKIIDAFDSWNQIFEDSTRLSVYKGALERGISREKAAILAKNATINFNKKGTGGPVINGLYMFSNASIQGTTKLLTAMKNPKVAAAVTTSVGTSVWAINSWNDSVDPDWRDKVPEWDRDSNMVVMLPGEEGAKYLTIPVSWGLKPMKVMADYAYDASNGKADQKNGWQVVGKVVSSLWDAYNPMGGTDITSSAVPSFLDIPVEIARNKKFSGASIRPEDREGVPASESFFQNKDGVPSDKSKIFGILRAGTKFVAEKTGGNIQLNPANLKYALEGYLSGAGKSFTGMAETVGAISGGELPQASDTPFARRFYKNKTEEEIAKSQKYDAKDDLYAKLKTLPKEEQAPVIQEYLNSLPADQRKGAAYGLFQEGFSTKGTTSSDDVIRMKPLVDKINKLEDEGKYDEVDQIIEGLSEEDLKSFKNAAKSVKAKASKDLTEQLKPKLESLVDQIIALENEGKYDESDELFYGLSEDEQKVVQKLIKQK